jgi:2-polyprenyl-3-methyl-5-hydroxy-6-metoxy-1,4-benzoquinol methylase
MVTREVVATVSIFDGSAHAEIYGRVRLIDPKIMNSYLALLQAHVGTKGSYRVLDVGAGTGLFTLAIAADSRFHPCIVTALDSAPAMLQELERRAAASSLDNITTLTTDINRLISPETRFDLVVCSEMVHLIGDFFKFAQIVNDALSPGGVVAIRTSSQEQLFHRGWYKDFPRARLIDMRRHKGIELMAATLKYLGYKVDLYQSDESHSYSGAEYLALMKTRPFSTLFLLEETEFEDGIASIERRIRPGSVVQFDYHMTMLVATQRPQ